MELIFYNSYNTLEIAVCIQTVYTIYVLSWINKESSRRVIQKVFLGRYQHLIREYCQLRTMCRWRKLVLAIRFSL